MNYDKFLKELYSLEDLKYKAFQSKIILSNDLIGVRTSHLKKIAKRISKENYLEFFRLNRHKLYEENLIHGLVLGYLKLDFDELKPLLNDFFPYIKNWAICDLTCSNLKIFKIKNIKETCFREIKKYIKMKNPWVNRFGYVLLLNYFVEDNYIDRIFELCNDYENEYYVKMSIAWLISVCYIKYKEKTLAYLKSSNLDNWTYNKAIQKIIESNRIGSDEKLTLKRMRKK